jgi:hypothetical protein
MNQPPAPTRSRRRWLVAIVLTGALFGWWLWPSADPRFVGRWEGYNSNASVPQPVCTIERFSNGRGRTTFSDGSPPDDFSWSVDGDRFRSNLIEGPIWRTIFRQMFARLWIKLSGNPYIPGVHELQIEQVDETYIRMRRDDGDWVIHRRVAQ